MINIPNLTYDEQIEVFKKIGKEKLIEMLIEANRMIVEQIQKSKALNEIENVMERWHHMRDNDNETIEKINEILFGVGRLEWFNKK